MFAQAANKQCMCRETSAQKLNGEEAKTNNTHKKEHTAGRPVEMQTRAMVFLPPFR